MAFKTLGHQYTCRKHFTEPLYSAFTETGATQTESDEPIRWQNRNNRFKHFQIRPIKRPVENNEISTCS